MYTETIGIVGGFGGFATLDFLRRLLETFATGYERDYPRIVMDNNFTMPSRTRSLLYDENYEEITYLIAKSIKNLISIGADKIVLPCGTSHWFLERVYQLAPEVQDKVVDIIQVTGEKLKSEEIHSCYVLAAEGSMKKKLFDKKLLDFGISVKSPVEQDWPTVRFFIEATKQNQITPSVKKQFEKFVLERVGKEQQDMNHPLHVILGCTELPPLVDVHSCSSIKWEDPLENVLKYLKQNLR